MKQAKCSINLAWTLYDDEQLDAADEAALHSIELLPENGQQYLACRGHRILGMTCASGGDREPLRKIDGWTSMAQVSSPTNDATFCAR